MAQGVPRHFAEQEAVVPGEVAGVEKAPLRSDRSDSHLIGIGPQQQPAHAVEASKLDVGHRSHAEVVAEALDQAAAAGMGLTAEIGQGDGLLGVVIQPALGCLHDLDARRWTRQSADLVCAMDQGLQEQGKQILQNQPLAKRLLQTPGIARHQGKDLSQIGTQALAANWINQEQIAAAGPLKIEALTTQLIGPVAQRVDGNHHQPQHHLPGEREVHLAATVHAE